MEITDTAKKIMSRGYICDHCLGRQFAQLLSGMTNPERGKAIRTVMAMEHDIKEQKIAKSNLDGFRFRTNPIKKEKGETEKNKCFVCDGLFDSIDSIADKVSKELSDLEYTTFLVGVRLSDKLLANEENLWEDFGIESTESIKKELTREIGKRVQEKTRKEVDLNNPEVAVLVNLDLNAVEVTINSLYIYGSYKKYAKIPQTKHYCPDCRGAGCDRCEWRGTTYSTSVQEIIAAPVLEETEGIDSKFHGQGREDVDVQCLGWRHFVLEILEPRKRTLDLKTLEKKINETADGALEINGLRYSDKHEVQKIKETHPDKTYLLTVKTETLVTESDLKKLSALVGTIEQQTPERVRHRRADITRKRKVFTADPVLKDSSTIEIKLKTEAGLYIKELATGDGGRTNPSMSGILGTKVEVLDLKVVSLE